MIKKLGRNITIVNIIAFIGVILVGGISLFLAKDILHNSYKTKEISEHIVIIDNMHADTFQYLLAIHHFLIDPDKVYAEKAAELLTKLEKDVTAYIAREKNEKYKEKTREIELLNEMFVNMQNEKKILSLFDEFIRTGSFDKTTFEGLEEFAYDTETLAREINRIHFKKIAEWERESLSDMWKIIILYIIFLAAGGISIYAGHQILSRKIVAPIKELAAATTEFSEGMFGKRVYTNSKTEIGLLYQSFNKMAEKLEEHNRFLTSFSEELEKKVRERTEELQAVNEQLRKAQKALIRTEKIAAIGQIAAGVAHEVKNPLNSLSINAQLLLREVLNKFGSDDPCYESASVIKSEINRINNILEEFVKFARFPEPQFMQDNINQVVTEVAEVISQNARDAGVTIKLSPGNNIPPFKFDAKQFKTVLINLSLNSISAMPEGGTLEIKTALKDRDILIYVTDTGKGIPEKDLEKIFSPFFSTKEGGLGLGLSIVQKIIENHSGRISCAGKVGEGTTFKVILPIERD